MKKSFVIITVAALVFAFCGICAAALPEGASDDEINAFITAPSSASDKMVIKYASTSPNLNGQSYLRAARKFLQTLKEELGDKIEIQYFMNSTFGGTADAVLGGLQNMTFELTDWPLGSFAELTNAFQPLDVPYLVTSSQGSYELLAGPAGEKMRAKCVEETGLMPLYYGIIGMRQLTNSKRDITSPDDMKGLKIRAQNNAVQVKGLSALGCSVTTMPFSELFTSLQQGVIDGQENPIETIYNFDYYEVQSHLTLSNHLCTAGAVVCNAGWFEGLPDDFKAAFGKAAAAAQSYNIADLQASEGQVLEKLRGLMKVTELSAEQVAAFQNAAKSAWPELKQEIGADYFDELIAAAGIKAE